MDKRYLKEAIMEDMKRKMVFIAGPRQVGKTTLAKQILELQGGLYYSWDRREDRRRLLQGQWPSEPTTVILDEIHKYSRWKRWLKGEYDKHRETLRVIVTGSARMDVYRKGGDSLQGRYHHFRLHPFSLAEISGIKNAPKIGQPLKFMELGHQETLENLLRFSGFPEPLLAQSETIHRRWQKERLERFFREDVRDLENVRELSQMELLADILPEKAGNLLSLNNLREDLEVSHRAISHWMDILERLYFSFRIYPYSAKTIRSLRKEPKLYLWDWSLIENQGVRFENLIASHLLKFCHFLEDTQGYKTELFYLRDVAKHEVDFLVCIDRKPWLAIETKLSQEPPSKNILYFKERLNIPYLFQVSFKGNDDFAKDGIRVLPASKFLSALV